MSDISTGPEAQGAQDDPDQSTDNPQGRSLLGRLFGALNASDSNDTPAAPRQTGDPILPGLSKLKKMRVADVSVPKAEIVAVPRDIERDALIDVFRKSGFSRLPVFNETLDKPMGLLLLKDLVLRDGLDLTDDGRGLDDLLRPLLYVPPSMSLLVLLQKMQTERMHMALVIDEYGGVEGLLTIEDLLEQVVGQIDDEHDTDDDALWHKADDGSWLIQARAPLEDLKEALGIDLTIGLEDEDVDTLGGVVFVLLGRVPARGEVIAHPAGPELQVLDADPRRVKRLRLRPDGPSAPPAE